MLFGGAYIKIYVFPVYLPCTAPLVCLGGHSLLDLVWRRENSPKFWWRRHQNPGVFSRA